MTHPPLTVNCPECHGEGFLTFGDRHCETKQDVCKTCKGNGFIYLRTGETPRSSATPSDPAARRDTVAFKPKFTGE